MPTQENKKVLAVVNDLFFSVKITEAAKHAGMHVEFVKDSKGILEKAGEKPALIIIDLNFDAIQPLELIGKLKENSDCKGVRLIGYLSHVQVELKRKAQEAGADIVMARSAFSQNLPQILEGHSGAS
jgi:PleD family two-component response regulator